MGIWPVRASMHPAPGRPMLSSGARMNNPDVAETLRRELILAICAYSGTLLNANRDAGDYAKVAIRLKKAIIAAHSGDVIDALMTANLVRTFDLASV
jgi:hypothetical protein